MKTKIILPLITLALLLAACGQNEQPAGKTASKTRNKAVAGAMPAILNQSEIDPNEVLSVSRKGEKVTIRWDVDFSACNGIRIVRNKTGMAKSRQTVANIPASSMEYVDAAPDPGVHWYWIAVGLGEGKAKYIGPIRVKADAGKTGKYTNPAQNISLVAQRTQAAVVVAWDLPEANYKTIVIRRHNKTEFSGGRNSRTNILTTKEWRGDLTDTLPDPHTDYWYWLDATREDGTIISKGPVKAQFSAR